MSNRFSKRQVRLVLVGETHKDRRASVVSDFVKEKGIKVNEKARNILNAGSGAIPREFRLLLEESRKDGTREAVLTADGTELPYTLEVDERGHIDGKKFFRWLIGHHGLDLHTLKVLDRESKKVKGWITPKNQLIQMLRLGFTEANLVEPMDEEAPGIVFVRSTPLGISWRAEDNGKAIPLADGLRPWYIPDDRRAAR